RLRPFLRNDVPSVPLVVQNGIGLRKQEIDGVIVDLDRLRVGLQPGLDVGAVGARALGGEHHVVRGKILAVVEFDALAQIEPPSRRLDHFPALGKAGNDLEILAALGQSLVDVAEHAEREGLVERVWIQGFEVSLKAETERRGGSLAGHRYRDGKREKCSLQFHRYLSTLPPMIAAAPARPTA